MTFLLPCAAATALVATYATGSPPMDRPPPPLNFIRSFECAARHLSLTKAAQELGYTQAAISMHVRALEKYIGRDLFTRNARSIELTEMGEAFLPTLRQALTQIDNATDAIATRSRDRSVVISCPMSLAENWLPACIAKYRTLHPDVEIVVHGTVWANPDDHIADIIISVNRNDELPPGAQRLWNETLSLVCDAELAKQIRGPADLAAVPKIIVAGRQEYWTAMADALQIAELNYDNAIKTNASNVSLELASHGLGATIALTSLCGLYTQRGILVEPLDFRTESPWAYYIVNHRKARSSSTEKLFDHIVAFGRTSQQQS
jgi:LysR family glycine cleavage system transcriptional activator